MRKPKRRSSNQKTVPISAAKRRTTSKRRTRRKPASASTRPESLSNHRRGRAINRSVSFVAGLFFVFVFIYLVRSVIAFIATPTIPTEVVKMGSIDLPQVVSAVIIRDEYVYSAGKDGRVSFRVNDYDRVKQGMAVCDIEDVQALERIDESRMSVEEQILQLQEVRQDISTVDPAVRRINAQIKSMVDSKLSDFTSLKLSEIYAMKDNVSQSLNIRNQMILEENKNIREDLGSQQQHLQNQRDNYVDTLLAQHSGIMSPILDGLEGVFTLETMRDLSKEQTQMKVDYNKIIPNKEVKAEDPVFKIIASNNWYIAAYMPNELIEGYQEEEMRILYVENQEESVPLTVCIELIEEGYKESFVLFKCTKQMIDYLNMRNIGIKTADSVHRGLKISNTAIAARILLKIPHDLVYQSDEREKQSYVIKQVEDGEVIIPIVPSESDENYVYIPAETGTLFIGDALVPKLAGQPVYPLVETETVQGVYKINNGYADFKKITLDTESPPTSGYSILNPALNQGIKAYDYIVSDASGVKDGQIIR